MNSGRRHPFVQYLSLIICEGPKKKQKKNKKKTEPKSCFRTHDFVFAFPPASTAWAIPGPKGPHTTVIPLSETAVPRSLARRPRVRIKVFWRFPTTLLNRAGLNPSNFGTTRLWYNPNSALYTLISRSWDLSQNRLARCSTSGI